MGIARTHLAVERGLRQHSSGTGPASRIGAVAFIHRFGALLARVYEAFPLLCPKCGGEMRIIAFITAAVAVRDILANLGEATSPPRMAPARSPPLWEMPAAGHGVFDPQAVIGPRLRSFLRGSRHRIPNVKAQDPELTTLVGAEILWRCR